MHSYILIGIQQQNNEVNSKYNTSLLGLAKATMMPQSIHELLAEHVRVVVVLGW